MNEIPPDLLAPLAQLGFAGVAIAFLVVALIRKDKQVDRCNEARVLDQKGYAADILKANQAIESMTQAMKARETANDDRWRVTEGVIMIVSGTADLVKANAAELNRIGRLLDLERARKGPE